jgi:DNA-directed RNA polymerase specialized sigma24 family protein
LAKVDAVYQAAVALFYLENRSYRDIALILKVPVGTIKSRIARGIAQLRQFVLSQTGRTGGFDFDTDRQIQNCHARN